MFSTPIVAPPTTSHLELTLNRISRHHGDVRRRATEGGNAQLEKVGDDLRQSPSFI
jgi:hypothetical protein